MTPTLWQLVIAISIAVPLVLVAARLPSLPSAAPVLLPAPWKTAPRCGVLEHPSPPLLPERAFTAERARSPGR